MRRKKPIVEGIHVYAFLVQKGNRITYIFCGKKYTGTVIKPLLDQNEIIVQPDGLDVTHQIGDECRPRLLKPSNRYRKQAYAQKNGLF